MDPKWHAPLAARQDGLLTRRQLLALGWTPDEVKQAVRDGWLHRVHRGVYSLTPRLTRRGRWRAAQLATGAAVSHVSAAAMHGLLDDRRIDVEVTTTRAIASQPGIVVRRTRSLPPSDVVQLHGIPVTTPTRTVLDLAQTVEQHLVLEAAMQALHIGTLDEQRVRTIDLRGRRGRRAMAVLQRRLETRTRSELEAAMHELCVREQISAPSPQHRIGRSTVDFAWPAQLLVVETDGWATHRGRDAFERDRARDAHLARRGWTVLRFTHRQLHEQPALVAAAIRARLDA